MARVGVAHSASPSLASRQEQVSDASQLAGGLAGATSGAGNWRERLLAGASTGGGVRRDPAAISVRPTHPGGMAAAPSLAAIDGGRQCRPYGPVGAAPHSARGQWRAVLLAHGEPPQEWNTSRGRAACRQWSASHDWTAERAGNLQVALTTGQWSLPRSCSLPATQQRQWQQQCFQRFGGCSGRLRGAQRNRRGGRSLRRECRKPAQLSPESLEFADAGGGWVPQESECQCH